MKMMKKISVMLLSFILIVMIFEESFLKTMKAEGYTKQVVSSECGWESFCVRQDLYGLPDTEWNMELKSFISNLKYQALREYEDDIITKEEYDNRIREADEYVSYTCGYFTRKSENGFDFYVENSGWDYGTEANQLKDQPLAMTVQLSEGGLPIVKGRTYTISFKIKSALKGRYSDLDKNGNTISKDVFTKHISLDIFNPSLPEESLIRLNSVEGVTTDGIITLDSERDEWKTVNAQFSVPMNYSSNRVGIRFALGARLNSYPEEVAMKGMVNVSDFEVSYESGEISQPDDGTFKEGQWKEITLDIEKSIDGAAGSVEFTPATSGKFSLYVDRYIPEAFIRVYDGENLIDSTMIQEGTDASINNLQKGKKYSLVIEVIGNVGATMGACNIMVLSNSVMDESNAKEMHSLEQKTNNVNAEQEVKATTNASKTVKRPSKVKWKKINNLPGKKVKLQWKNVIGAKGFKIEYSLNSKFKKGKKTIIVTGTSKTIKKLKKKKIYYFRICAFKKTGKKRFYGEWSTVQHLTIKK